MWIGIKELARKIGLNKSIAYSSGARVVQGFTGVASVFFITSFLTGVEQGFYYTFGSILALQVFFELGLTGIMTQYVAHEASHLSQNETGIYEDEEKYRSRLASLLKFCVKWYSAISVLVFVFLMIVGYVYFNKYGGVHSDVDWQIPWILICIGTAIKLFQSPLTSIFMGLGFVKDMSKAGFYQQIILPAFTWMGLACGFKLYVMGIGFLLSVIYWQVFIVNKGLAKILINLWHTNIVEKVGYMKEIFPYQWRIALSWVSGYFIFQLFNPVLFATEGATVAGQMGMTLQALSAIQAFSFSWLNTKIPLYSKLIALKDYIQLNKIFNKTLKQMVSVCFALLLCFFLVIWILHITELSINGNLIANRFLDYLPMLLMMIPVFLQQFVNSWATYLRCHKKEPFLVYSICAGIFMGSGTFIFGRLYGLYGITICYCILSILFFPWGYYLYQSNRKKWHGEYK